MRRLEDQPEGVPQPIPTERNYNLPRPKLERLAGDIVPFPKEVGSGSIARQLQQSDPMRSMAGQHSIKTSPKPLDLMNIFRFPGGQEMGQNELLNWIIRNIA
jgi:hypothetical protein